MNKPAKRLLVRKLLGEGKRTKAIHDICGASADLVRAVRDEMGLPAWPRGGSGSRKNHDKHAFILMMKQSGMSYGDIVKKLGHSLNGQWYFSRGQPSGRGVCSSCGKGVNCIHRHHINYLTNKTINLCAKCHVRKHKKDRVAALAALRKKKTAFSKKFVPSMRKKRMKIGLSVKEVANHMGKQKHSVWLLERGRSYWSPELAALYEKALVLAKQDKIVALQRQLRNLIK